MTDIAIVKIRDLPDAITVVDDDELIIQQVTKTGKTKISKVITDMGLVKSHILGNNTGASMIGTSSGENVQQVLDLNTEGLVELYQPGGAEKVGTSSGQSVQESLDGVDNRLSEFSGDTGASLIGTSTGATVQEYIDMGPSCAPQRAPEIMTRRVVDLLLDGQAGLRKILGRLVMEYTTIPKPLMIGGSV